MVATPYGFEAGSNPKRRWLALSPNSTVGLVLLFAAALKCWDWLTMPYTHTIIFSVVVFTEAALGTWLLINSHSGTASVAAVIAFACFAIYSLFQLVQGASSCGCFGRLEVSPAWTFIFDSIATAMLTLHLYRARHNRERRSSSADSLLCSFALLSAFALLIVSPTVNAYRSVSPLASSNAHATLLVLEPQQWLGKSWPFLANTDIADKLSQGEWTVILHRRNCSRCEALIREYTSRPQDHPTALVELPSGDNVMLDQQLHTNATPFVTGRLKFTGELICTTPVVLHLLDGNVIGIE